MHSQGVELTSAKKRGRMARQNHCYGGKKGMPPNRKAENLLLINKILREFLNYLIIAGIMHWITKVHR